MYVQQTQIAGPAHLPLASNAATCATSSVVSIITATDWPPRSPTGATKSNGLSGKTEMAGRHLRMSQIRADTPMIRTLRAAVY